MNWKEWLIPLLIAVILIIIALNSGCSLFQMSGADRLGSLPTTGPEAMFQTLKKANWLFTIAVLGSGAGFYAFLNGSNKGLQFMAACFVVISLIIGITRYSAVIAVVSLIGAVCLMIYSTLVKGKALREVVEGVQDVREAKFIVNQSPLPRSTIDMRDAITDALASAQSKTTKAIVKAVKGKL